MTLDVRPYDPVTDSIMIEGIRYAGDLLRGLGRLVPVGSVVRIEKRDDDVLTLRTLHRFEPDSYLNCHACGQVQMHADHL